MRSCWKWQVDDNGGPGLVNLPSTSSMYFTHSSYVSDTLLNAKPGTWALVVVPQRNVAVELISDLRPPCRDVGLGVEMVVDGAAFLPVKQRLIRVITGSQLLAAFSADHLPALTGLRMVICDNLEQLHPAYELGVSLLRHSTQTQATRYVGVSSSLNDAADLAAWFGVDPMALHSFRPRDRDQPLQISTQTFTIPQSAALFKSMAKPCHAAIKDASEESAIIFIPSRGQCRSIALDLITQCALDMASSRGYLPVSMPEELLEHHLARLRDQTLADFVSNGVGFFHDAMRREDRALMLELFAEGVVRVLLVPREACWTLPARAGVVVVLGTQYVHVEPARDERQVREYGLTELVRMQSRAVRENKLGRFHLFCQVESKDTYTRFLDEGLPLESELLGSPVFSTWYSSARRSGRIADKGAAVQALSWTFLARRLVSNPTYYDSAAGVGSRDDGLSRIVDALEESKRP
jgi:antiviral helicase SLH1